MMIPSLHDHRVRAAARAALALGVLILVTSCTSSSDQGREAGVLGTRICVKSQSPTLLYVTFDSKDTSTGEGQLTSGAQACAEGSSGGLALDVSGKIQIQGTPIRELNVYAQNIWIGAPMAYLKQKSPTEGYCTSYDGMDINDVRIWDDGLQRFVVTRRADDQWKEFTVEVYDSQDPSADGTARPCTGK